ncbi:MAG: alpha/beta fold hydrolase [Pseudomonadota bacterium]
MNPAVAQPFEAEITPTVGHDIDMPVSETWRARSGAALPGETIRLRLVGNPRGKKILVLGGISAGREICGETGWWKELAGQTCALDTEECLIIGLDYPPLSADTPVDLCTEDFARLVHQALRSAGIDYVDGLIGMSFGGMIGLAFARLYPEAVGRLALLCAAHRPSPMASAWRLIQRQILELARDAGDPERGVAIARQLAITTYRAPEEFDSRFAEGEEDSLISYLGHQGAKYARQMPSGRYQTLSSAINAHHEVPEDITVPTLVIAADTDRLVPPGVGEELADRLPHCLGFEIIQSVYGHDSFLKETEILDPIIRKFIAS